MMFFCCIAIAQKLKFENYTSKDELISDDVYNLHQDQKGYIWLFTNYGTIKYNGSKFESVLKNLSIKESFIYCMYENDKGNKWVVNSNAKIFEIRNDSAFLVKGTEKASSTICKTSLSIYQIYVDDSCNIYLSSHRSSYKLIKNENYYPKRLIHLKNEEFNFVDIFGFKNNTVFTSFNDEPQDLTAHFKEKLKLNFLGPTIKDTLIVIDYNSVIGPTYFKKYVDEIYFRNQNLLFKIKNYKIDKIIKFKSFILNYIKDSNKHIWVGCYNDGLYELDENDSIINHYFDNRTINDVLVDTQNGLWISTEGLGIFHCRDLNTNYYTEPDLLGGSISFIKKIKNKLFIANSRGAIFLQENNKLTKIHDENLSNGEPLDVINDQDIYFISYSQGFERVKLQNNSLVKIISKKGPLFHAYKLLKGKNDTLIYMTRRGINIGMKDDAKMIKLLRFDYKVYSIERRNGIILIATDHGIYQIIGDKLFMPNYLRPTENEIITKIVIDDLNNYWFCTKGSGLFKLTPENVIRQYTITDLLPSNIVYDISFNKDNSILLSTNKGLYYNDGLNNYLTRWFELYPEEVKSAILFNHKIYITTNGGLVIINEKTMYSRKPIYLNVKSIMVNGFYRSQDQLKQLRYNENNLEFNFDVISYSTSLPKIKYELSGDKSEEGTLLTQQLNFNNLDAGQYKLKVTLFTSENIGTPVVINFSIEAAIWQTLRFKILALFSCLIFCFLIGWVIFKFYKKKEDKKNEISRLITEYKLIALKAQINPHFISNCLTAIQHLIISNKLDEANQYLAKFSFLVRQVLNFSSKSFVTLHEELELTKLNIELEKLRFEDKFEYIIEMNLSIDFKDIFVPPLIFQPIVENAIWHGLLPLKQNKKALLKIKIEELNNFLNIIIEDNGVGRINKSNDIGNIRDSKGIKIVKQRIQNLSILSGDSEGDVLFEDLIDDSGNANGLRVKILLPIITITDIKNEN